MFTVLEVEAALVTYKKIEVDRYRVEAAPSLKIGLPTHTPLQMGGRGGAPHTLALGWIFQPPPFPFPMKG